jgi:thioredoxin-dependent peroxiredoxin
MAPDFTSVDQNNKPVKLSDFTGKYVLLYFYPKDDTPGCTIQANDFTAMADKFSQQDCIVIGVSKDDCASHQAFIKKFNLNLILLSDTDAEVCSLYDVLQPRERDGQTVMGIMRSTFVIDRAGKLIFVEYSVNPDGHAEKILQLIKDLQ